MLATLTGLICMVAIAAPPQQPPQRPHPPQRPPVQDARPRVLVFCTIDDCVHCEHLKARLDLLPRGRWAVEVRKNDWPFFRTWCVRQGDRVTFPQLILADPDRTVLRQTVGALSTRELDQWLAQP